jgi:hypothetical protein
MSFLARHKNQQDSSSSGDNEELYEKLFVKIGRDFVYKEDLQEVLSQITAMLYSINPIFMSNPVNTASDAKARLKAVEYKGVLDSGKDGSKIYKDLIKLDDKQDEPDGS